MTVFIDTGGWIAVAISTDEYHDIAALYHEELVSQHTRFVTSDYVLDETVTRIRYDVGHASAIAFLDLVHEAERAGSLNVLTVDPSTRAEAERIFRQYHDHVFSFTDCTSFVLATRTKANEVFTFDGDFRIFGFVTKP